MFIEDSWKSTVEKILLSKRIMLLGAIDSGKSTFARYVLSCFIHEGLNVTFVDSDVGQSSIAVPGTIGIKRITKLEDINSFADRLFFFGSVTPSASISRFLKVFQEAIKTADSYNIPVVVDTTGFISGDGKFLKLKKIEIFKPDLVVGFQRTDEIEEILNEIQVSCIVFKPSIYVKPRNLEERDKYRKRKFQKYFHNSESYLFPINMLQTKDKGFVYQKEKYIGKIAGLFTDETCISIGLIEDIDEKTVEIKTPLSEIKTIRKILLSEITLNLH